MKPLMLIGILLVVLGVVGLVVQGITYTTQEKVADVGPVHVTSEKQKTVQIPLIAGAACLGAGIAILIIATRK